MIGVYAPQEAARRVIHGVNAMHARVSGRTPDNAPYSASDPDLLDWVSATASYGFLTAYERFVAPLNEADARRFYTEAEPIARLYGAQYPPHSRAAFNAMLRERAVRFQAHPIVHEFLLLFTHAPGPPELPRALRRTIADAAISILPPRVQARLDLAPPRSLRSMGALRAMAALAERIPAPNAPATHACRRLGLPANFLYRNQSAQKRLLARG